MRARSTYWITQIILLAFLLLGLGSLNGMVLCFEPDGRVSIESAVGGACSDSVQEFQKSSDKPTIQATHCKSCVDIPLSIESAEQKKQQLQSFQVPVQMPMLAEVPSVSIGYLTTATEVQMPQPPPLRPVIHEFLNTVILLI